MVPVRKRGKKVKRRKAKKKVRPEDLFKNNKGLAYEIGKKFWEKNSGHFKKLAMDKEDVQQIALHELSLLAPKYDGRTKFSTFAWVAMENRLKVELEKARAQKRSPGSIKSLSNKIPGGEKTFEGTVQDRRKRVKNVEFNKEVVKIVNGLQRVQPKYRTFFFERFGLAGEPGKSYTEIAEKHKTTPRIVEYGVERVLEMLKRHPEMKHYKDLL